MGRLGRRLVGLGIGLAVVTGAYVGGDWLLARSARQALDQLQASLPPGTSLRHGAMTTSLLSRQVSISDVEFDTTASLPLRQVKIARLDFRGLPWINARAVRLGQINLYGLKAEGEYKLSLDTLTADRPGYQLFAQIAAFPDDVQALSFDRAQIHGLTFSHPAARRALSIADLTLGMLDNGKLASATGSGFEISGPAIDRAILRLSFQSLALEQANLGRLWPVLRGGSWEALLASDALASADIAGLTLSRNETSALDVGGVTLGGTVAETGVRTSFSLTVTGLVLQSAGWPAQLQQALRTLGYETLAGRVELSASYDPATVRLKLDRLLLDFPEAVSVQAGFHLQNFNLAALANSAAPSASLMATSALTMLIGGEVQVTDHGLIGRYVRSEAARLQVDPPVYVEQLIDSWRPSVGSSGPGAQRIGQFYRAVSSFMMNPGQLTLTAAPQRPLPVFQLFIGMDGVDDLLERLELKSQHRQLRADSPEDSREN